MTNKSDSRCERAISAILCRLLSWRHIDQQRESSTVIIRVSKAATIKQIIKQIHVDTLFFPLGLWLSSTNAAGRWWERCNDSSLTTSIPSLSVFQFLLGVFPGFASYSLFSHRPTSFDSKRVLVLRLALVQQISCETDLISPLCRNGKSATCQLSD